MKIGNKKDNANTSTDSFKNMLGDGGNPSTSDVVDRVVARTQRRYDTVSLDCVYPNRKQPREDFNEIELHELGDSILEYGLIEPIVVRESNEQPGQFELAAGERRWRAMHLKGIVEADAIILDADCSDEMMEQIALIENIQRKDLTPYEIAKAYYRLWKDEHGKTLRTVTEVSKLVNKSEYVVDEYLAIMRASEEVRQLIIDDPTIPRRIIRDLATVENPEDRAFLIEEVRAGALNANALTRLLQRSRQLQQNTSPISRQATKTSPIQGKSTSQDSEQSKVSVQQDQHVGVQADPEGASTKRKAASPALKLAALEQRLRKEGEAIRKVTEKLTEDLSEMSSEEKDAVNNCVEQWSIWMQQLSDLVHQ